MEYGAPPPALRPERRYAYLVRRPHQWRRQLCFKGRRLTVGQFLGRKRTEKWTPEQAAAEFELPLEAAYEAIDYGEHFRFPHSGRRRRGRARR